MSHLKKISIGLLQLICGFITKFSLESLKDIFLPSLNFNSLLITNRNMVVLGPSLRFF